MTLDEILEELRYLDPGRFPHAAVEAAVEQREEIIPHLLEILRETIAEHRRLAKDQSYMAHLYAMFLLAQFREPQAHPLIAELAQIDPESLDALLNDSITDSLPRALASTFDGDLEAIRALIENPEADEFARGSGLEALTCLWAHDLLGRAEIIAYLEELFAGKLERSPSNAWDALSLVCRDLCANELREQIVSAFEEELIDPLFETLEDLEESWNRGVEASRKKVLRTWHKSLIEDTTAEMSGWYCFRDESRNEFLDPFEDTDVPPGFEPYLDRISSVPPIHGGPAWPQPRQVVKIGRNEPCPCGSGKKYKKCCGSPAAKTGGSRSSTQTS